MNVVLDTNIYRQDLAVRSARFDILLDYLRKTGSRIVLPRLVYDELAAHLARELREVENRARAAHRDFSRLMPHRQSLAPLSTLDPDKEARDYMQYLLQRLGVQRSQLVDHKNDYLPDVLTRAMERRRPCSPAGEEIRDAVLWLTILDVAESDPDRAVAFVSHNTKQFADANHVLHPDLAAESTKRGVVIRYFPSLEEFAKQQAQPVAFATPGWLQKNVRNEDIFDKARDGILRIAERSFESRQNPDEIPSGDVELLSGHVSDPDLFVYEMLDGSFRVEAIYSGYAEVSFSVHRWADWDDAWDYLSRYSRDRETAWRSVEVWCLVNVEATVRDEKVMSWSVTDVESL